MPKTVNYYATCILFWGILVVALSITSCMAENVTAPIESPDAASQMTEQPLLTVTSAVISERNTLTPVVSTSTTPDISPAPPTLTLPVMPFQTPTIKHLGWNLKIAFTSLNEDGGAFVSRLWVVELPETEARQLIDFRSASNLSENRVSWSHSGQNIAFSHHADEDKVSVSIINVADSTVKQLGFSFPLDPFNTGNSSAINLFHDSWSLDDQWVQASLSYFEPDSNSPVTQELLLNTVNGQVIELDEQIEFVAWSKSTPDQFLYIMHPDSEMGYSTVHVGQIGLDEPIISILDLGKYSPGSRFNIDWSSDNTRAVATSYDVGTRNTSVVLIDLQQEMWELLYTQQSYDELPIWSLDGRWVVMWHKDGLYVWEIDKTDQPSAPISLQTELVTPLSWLPTKNWLVYQADDVLYAVNPETPDSPIEILNLNSLGVSGEQRIQASVWIPSQP